jgi:hypothetical protein
MLGPVASPSEGLEQDTENHACLNPNRLRISAEDATEASDVMLTSTLTAPAAISNALPQTLFETPQLYSVSPIRDAQGGPVPNNSARVEDGQYPPWSVEDAGGQVDLRSSVDQHEAYEVYLRQEDRDYIAEVIGNGIFDTTI